MGNRLNSRKAAVSNEIYTFQRPRRQRFSICFHMMNHVLENASPNVWKKLLKTCKHFYSKEPVFPVANLCSSFSDGSWSGDCGRIDINQPLVKLWLYDALIALTLTNTLSSLIPKIKKCTIQTLLIRNQNLTWKEYHFLTVSGLITSFSFIDSTVKYSDGKTVTFDKLLINLKNIKCLTFDSADPRMIERETVKHLVKILPNLEGLSFFALPCLGNSFDITLFTDFLLKNETVKFYLRFDGSISDEFKQVIDKCCQKIIKNPFKVRVWIRYPGMDEIQFDQLKKLYDGE